MFTRRKLAAGAAALGLVGREVSAQGQTFRVGSTPTGIPFTFLDTRSNTLTGFMVDLIGEVGRRQGFAVDVQATPFAALIASLTSNRIDLIAAAMLATPARREQIDFSDPVYGYGEGAAIRESETRPWRSLADMRGVTAGAQIGTIYIEPLRAAGLEVRTYDSVADIMRDVSLGRIQAGFGDAPIVSYQIAQGTFRGVKLVPDYRPSVVGSIAIGARKGDPVIARVNAGLAAIKADGAFARLVEKWNLPASVD
ncbi:ABC transporter substrate-binding protein [Roseococcus pinisoli]|uniref:Amino acid ABC transporter substrate-binding protein n=1 Tax=Roseococcus pinisoli TaxID=2835040 RepID=A0ABS5QJ23_9PROT|nr:ABC transporter substrate-binding protein [Roseococcus pinisoli]MBS7813687.1 amino acid ABC transporter substrate-binding protein [Roseococcus pinisoli]